MTDYTPFPVWPRPSTEGGGVTSHGALTGRSSADAHPISAVTGLQDALNGAGGAQTVHTVTSAIAFDLTGLFDPTDPNPVALADLAVLGIGLVGWTTAIFGQADPSWNGIWEGQTVPAGEVTVYLPLVKVADLPTENGVIVTEYLSYDMDTLMAPPVGGWIIAQATQVDGDAGGIGTFGTLPGDGWSVVYSTQYWADQIATGGADLSDAAAQDLGTAAAGVSEDAARADHVHDMPTAADIAVDASGFNGNLTTSDDTVQEIAQKVDDLVIPAAGIADPGGANDDFLQRKSGVWTNRTVAQVKTDLGVTSETEHAPESADPLWFTDEGAAATSNTLHYMLTAGHQAWLPVRLTPGTYDRIAVHSTVAAVSTWRLGIDSSTSQFRPGTNLLDAGTVDMNATAGTQAITIAFVVAATDWFWLRVKCDAFTGSPTTFVAYGLSGANDSITIAGWPAYGIGVGRHFPGLLNAQDAGSGPFAAPPPFTGAYSTGIGYAQGLPKVYLRRSA